MTLLILSDLSKRVSSDLFVLSMCVILLDLGLAWELRFPNGLLHAGPASRSALAGRCYVQAIPACQG